MKHLRELCELITTINTRIGTPDEHMEAPEDANDPSLPNFEELCHPMYSTGIGLVLYGMEQEMLIEEDEEEVETLEDIEVKPIIEQVIEKEPELDPNDIFAKLGEMKPSEPKLSDVPHIEPAPQPTQTVRDKGVKVKKIKSS